MIDTLEFAKTFQQAGFDQPKAEALAGAFARARDVDRAELATKADLLATKQDLQLTSAQTETRIDGKLADLKLDTERTIRNYVLGGNVGLILVLVVLQHFAKVLG